MTHIYDWLDAEPKDEGERLAKEWLEYFCMPAYDKHLKKVNAWLEARKLTCVYKGRRLQCTGASRMGDVWLKEPGSKSFYDHRVSVDDLSEWERTDPPATPTT